MDKEEGFGGLIDENEDPLRFVGTNLGGYVCGEFERETNKKWLYKGRHPRLRIDICIKVLKPKIRKDSFLGEIKNLEGLNHRNIERIFDAGKDRGYDYVVTEWVKGKNLRESIDDGVNFSQEEVLELGCSILEALDYSDKREHPHTDVKLENIILEENGENDRPFSERVHVVDFGPWNSDNPARDHVSGTAGVLRKLLDSRGEEDSKQRIPNGLEKRLKKAENLGYETPGEFKDALEDFRRGIPRRKFLEVTGSGLVLSGLIYSGYKYLDYVNSMDFVAKQIAQTKATDYEKIDPLFRELALRIFDQKIRLLVETGKIPRRKFTYATIENGSWFLTEGGYWTEGFWPGILWNAYEVTGKDEYKDWATEWTRAIDFTERDKTTIRSIRFYYSHAKAFELTGDEFYRDQALKATGFMASRFKEVGGFIQASGITDSDTQTIFIDTMTTALPLLSWAYTQTNNDSIRDVIIRHCNATIQCNVNEDGSTIQRMEFDPRTMIRVRGIKHDGFNENSCLSRGQARAIKGFTTAYQTTGEERFLEAAERCAGYFINNLPEDFVPFYDFDDPNKNIPKDSSAAAITSSALLDLHALTGNERYKITAYNILKSLSSRNYLSTDLRNYQGIIMHSCANKNMGEYLDSSLTYGDYFYLESLRKII